MTPCLAFVESRRGYYRSDVSRRTPLPDGPRSTRNMFGSGANSDRHGGANSLRHTHSSRRRASTSRTRSSSPLARASTASRNANAARERADSTGVNATRFARSAIRSSTSWRLCGSTLSRSSRSISSSASKGASRESTSAPRPGARCTSALDEVRSSRGRVRFATTLRSPHLRPSSQLVVSSARTWAGVRHPRTSRGRSFSSAATQRRSAMV